MSVQVPASDKQPDVQPPDSDESDDLAETSRPNIEELSTDRIFHLLQNERRRATLRYLQDTDGVVDMRDIVEHVAAEEYDTDVRSLSSTERQRVYIALYQSHLPKLADSGVIEYDQSRGHVERTALADALDPYLTDQSGQSEVDITEDRQPWTGYYLGASFGGLVLLLAGYLNAVPMMSVSGYALASVIVASFGALALVQRYGRS